MQGRGKKLHISANIPVDSTILSASAPLGRCECQVLLQFCKAREYYLFSSFLSPPSKNHLKALEERQWTSEARQHSAVTNIRHTALPACPCVCNSTMAFVSTVSARTHPQMSCLSVLSKLLPYHVCIKRFRVQAILAKDPGTIPSTYMAELTCDSLFWPPWALYASTWLPRIHTGRQNSLTLT